MTMKWQDDCIQMIGFSLMFWIGPIFYARDPVKDVWLHTGYWLLYINIIHSSNVCMEFFNRKLCRRVLGWGVNRWAKLVLFGTFACLCTMIAFIHAKGKNTESIWECDKILKFESLNLCTPNCVTHLGSFCKQGLNSYSCLIKQGVQSKIIFCGFLVKRSHHCNSSCNLHIPVIKPEVNILALNCRWVFNYVCQPFWTNFCKLLQYQLMSSLPGGEHLVVHQQSYKKWLA